MCKQILAQATHLPAERTGSMMKDEPQQSTDYSEMSYTPQSDTISPVEEPPLSISNCTRRSDRDTDSLQQFLMHV